jgi:hypothetical protein
VGHASASTSGTDTQKDELEDKLDESREDFAQEGDGGRHAVVSDASPDEGAGASSGQDAFGAESDAALGLAPNASRSGASATGIAGEDGRGSTA